MQLVLQNVRRKCGLCRVNPLSKMLMGLLFFIIVLLSRTQSTGQLVWLTLWSAAALCFALSLNRGLKSYFLRSAVMFFLLTIALPFTSFTAQESALMQLADLHLFKSGLWRFATLFLKAMLLLSISLIIVSSTPYPQLLQAFQTLKMPGWILAIFMYMFRLLFLMEEENQRLKRAIRARSGKLTLKRKLKILIDFSVVYLARLTERSERNYQALVSRGFRGKIRLLDDPALPGRDLLLLLWPVLFLAGTWL